MTYREQIQRLIQIIDLGYDLAGAMRDTAVGPEKETFNLIREFTGECLGNLKRLDNHLDGNRAAMELGDNFEKYIKKTLELS